MLDQRQYWTYFITIARSKCQFCYCGEIAGSGNLDTIYKPTRAVYRLTVAESHSLLAGHNARVLSINSCPAKLAVPLRYTKVNLINRPTWAGRLVYSFVVCGKTEEQWAGIVGSVEGE